MNEAWSYCDALGPYRIVHIHRPRDGLRAILVVDNVACGPSIGGVRMAPDVSLEECFRLARSMTLKNAAAGLPHGGGKSVIVADPRMPEPRKANLMRAFAQAIRPFEDYIAGPDMGTDETCMAHVHDEIGRAVGLPAELGGIPLDEIGATGFGLCVAAMTAEAYCDVKLSSARVAIQGFGSVGTHAARFLAARGAAVVAVSDSAGASHNANGLDVAELIAHKRSGSSVATYANGSPITDEEMVGVECDIWIPAARPDVINDANMDSVRAKLIVPGANIPAPPAVELALGARGVLVIPDFIANAGGVICAAVEYAGGSREDAFTAIEQKVAENTAQVLESARGSGTAPRAAAIAMAELRIRTAMQFSRYA